jgi:Epoxide hydrolase N terminus
MFLKELVDYWQHEFNWRNQEARLSKLDRFKARIDGVSIHFVQIKAEDTKDLTQLSLHMVDWTPSIASTK